MERFQRLDAIAAPLGMANVDTDQITPARFLWRPRHAGYAEVLFHDLRRNEDGSLKSDFVLNRPEYRDAKILVAERNFGCGSSREHAVWALYDHGFRAVIAPSFGDIFFNNCFKNGLLPVRLPPERVAALRSALERAPGGGRVTVDLEAQQVTGPDGAVDRFEIDPFRKELLLQGLDEIEFTLRHEDAIRAFEARYEAAPRPSGEREGPVAPATGG
jgi:3-isopropylmalate/(R)-2-methylmalate dehydratase small subunit